MYTNNFIQVGKNIQTFLSEKGKTQQNLADAMGISKQVMSKIIKGAKAINVNELSKIASVLGTTTDSLLTMNTESEIAESMAFMGTIQNEDTRNKVEMLRSAIDEILLLEELAHA